MIHAFAFFKMEMTPAMLLLGNKSKQHTLGGKEFSDRGKRTLVTCALDQCSRSYEVFVSTRECVCEMR